jgi:hypothetical protein
MFVFTPYDSIFSIDISSKEHSDISTSKNLGKPYLFAKLGKDLILTASESGNHHILQLR